jgi:uncharacterized cupredoxin-like copper-binding protein
LLALAGLSAASASQLAVDGGTLQAGVGTVTTCQPSGQVIEASFTSTFDAGAYQSDSVRFANVAAACQGATYRVQLLSPSGAVIDMSAGSETDVTGPVDLTGGAFTVDFPSTPAASIGRVALVLSK